MRRRNYFNATWHHKRGKGDAYSFEPQGFIPARHIGNKKLNPLGLTEFCPTSIIR